MLTIFFVNFKIWRVTALTLILIANAYASDEKKIKHGEWLFLNYCSGCHSLQYTSYPLVSMPEKDAKLWFGLKPPDLSLVAKSRGKSWLRDYLTGFYSDEDRPFGTNNKVFPNVQMPNVLFALQNTSGSNSVSYQQAVADIVEFLDFVSEPSKMTSYKLGFIVLLFLAILVLLFGLFFVSYASKKTK